jgi:hypothetical protein
MNLNQDCSSSESSDSEDNQMEVADRFDDPHPDEDMYDNTVDLFKPNNFLFLFDSALKFSSNSNFNPNEDLSEQDFLAMNKHNRKVLL